MDNICRLCCTNNSVNNEIFDEESDLFMKMSLYLPIKVFKNDDLPQRICEGCTRKVDDFYQFCNNAVESQNRLRSVFVPAKAALEVSVNLTIVKPNIHSPGIPVDPPSPCVTIPPAPQTSETKKLDSTIPCKPTCDQTTQTEELDKHNHVIDKEIIQPVKIKQEPNIDADYAIKLESLDDDFQTHMSSDNSDDNISLINFQRKKKGKKRRENGEVKKKSKSPNIPDLELLLRSLPESLVVNPAKIEDMKVDLSEDLEDLQVKQEQTEPLEYICCVCYVQCYSRKEMLKHYRDHLKSFVPPPPPAAPPLPPQPIRCPRCRKKLTEEEWSPHFLRHWARDQAPLRCAYCGKTFRDPGMILKHGLTHKAGVEESEPPAKYLCDLCGAGFAHVRVAQTHRARAHPEAAARALLLRCATCQRSFSHQTSLRRHLASHTGQRDFLCNICGKALSSREHLKFHIRIHTGYKPHACKTCGKAFVKKCNLTLHERVHSGEKPHVCSHCGKAFGQRSTLVIHERYHSGARPYACTLCGRGFVAKGLLSMHLKTTCI